MIVTSLNVTEPKAAWDKEFLSILQKQWYKIAQFINGFATLPVAVNNAAALTKGLKPGMLYRTGTDPDTICIVH